jgi:anaerobic magnesium-protoporphyrin IX monomethyl ester cyclase
MASFSSVPGSGGRVPGLRLLLVDPYLRREDPMERKGEEQYPSLGLLSLAAYARQQGADVRVVDLTFARGLEPFHRELRAFAPDVVGVHTKTLTLPRSLAIARKARAAGAFVLAGGPDSSSRPEAYLAGGFDVVAAGEGETTLVDILRARSQGESLFGLPGVVFRHEGRTVRGPPRPLVPHLDSLPLPAWDLIDMGAYLSRWERVTGTRRMAVVTSRGCPFDCSWCSKPTFGRSFRQRSVGSVMQELGALRQFYGVDYVRICDDVFGIQRRWTEEFLDGLIARGWGLKFECLSRADLLKPELLPRLRAAGLRRVFLGVESGSQAMLDLMNRGTTLGQVERASAALRAHGIDQYWFLMLGYPGETLGDLDATVRLFRRFAPEEYSVSVALPLPGTRLERVLQGGTDGEAGPAEHPPVLYQGVYPPPVYRWTRARMRFWRRLDPITRRYVPAVGRRLSSATHWWSREIARKVLTGGPGEGTAPEGPLRSPWFGALFGQTPPRRSR